jgi:hypothetical protein
MGAQYIIDGRAVFLCPELSPRTFFLDRARYFVKSALPFAVSVPLDAHVQAHLPVAAPCGSVSTNSCLTVNDTGMTLRLQLSNCDISNGAGRGVNRI